MIIETLIGVSWRIDEEPAADGSEQRILTLIDEKAGRVTRIPFDVPAAKKLGAQLSGLVVTTVMPPGKMNGSGPH